MNGLLTFEMEETNSALKAIFLSYTSLFGFLTIIVPFTTIYASVRSHKSDLSIDFFNLICLLGLYLSSAYLTDH